MKTFCLKNDHTRFLLQNETLYQYGLQVCAGIENKIFYKFKIVLTLCYQYTLLV